MKLSSCKKILFVVFLCSLSVVEIAEGQTVSTPRDSVIWTVKRKDFATYGTIAFSGIIVALEYQWWWNKNYLWKRHEFRFQSDGWFDNYSLGVDKLGHMYTSYLFYHTAYDLMRWADFDETTAKWIAFTVPFSHALSVEIGDGFSKWAFSWTDLTSNCAGIAYAWLQVEHPFLRNFNIKWSYFPTVAYSRPDNDWGPSHDYSGHFYWLSVDVHNLLPEQAQHYWPKFLNLAVGYGAKNVSLGDDINAAAHKYAVSLDWKMTELPGTGDTWEIVKNVLDKFHFPAPGVKIQSDDKQLLGRALLLN